MWARVIANALGFNAVLLMAKASSVMLRSSPLLRRSAMA